MASFMTRRGITSLASSARYFIHSGDKLLFDAQKNILDEGVLANPGISTNLKGESTKGGQSVYYDMESVKPKTLFEKEK